MAFIEYPPVELKKILIPVNVFFSMLCLKFTVTVSYLDLPSHFLYRRDEQTPLLTLRPQLQADPPPPPGSIRGRELQTSRVSLETRPGRPLLLPNFVQV